MTRPVAARRPLPPGYADEDAAQFIPRPLRSFYQTVTAPTDQFADVVDAVERWVITDYQRTGRMPR